MILPTEHESRRPNWTRGTPLVLADGDIWNIPHASAAPLGPFQDPTATGGSWLVGGRHSPELSKALENLATLVELDSDGALKNEGIVTSLLSGELCSTLLMLNYEIDIYDAWFLLFGGFLARRDLAGLSEVLTVVGSLCDLIDFAGMTRVILGHPNDPIDN